MKCESHRFQGIQQFYAGVMHGHLNYMKIVCAVISYLESTAIMWEKTNGI